PARHQRQTIQDFAVFCPAVGILYLRRVVRPVCKRLCVHRPDKTTLIQPRTPVLLRITVERTMLRASLGPDKRTTKPENAVVNELTQYGLLGQLA
ncbi:MAG: hypothetical protein ACC648_07010, partial [Thiohalobacterales bacterium]